MGDTGISNGIILKCILDKSVCGFGLDYSDLGEAPVPGSCELVNKSSRYFRFGRFNLSFPQDSAFHTHEDNSF